ncbi:ankyrin repeat domain-containing protein [Aspergillus mulundensis]|uniref:Uncharacterized protein n=1 Tax=Aspergillus mulundensis TaxID=1810919 RepID=A0A3D8RYD1_9EURO|nr:Uncharacterized protein DSM5745_05911 [Aspergillus mulundensis]RDW79059.1 Uncharacterized protein DSM5745_05911 [Aspergillus mulundensis]
MSFGYGAGDFLSVMVIANDIRKRFVYAPTQFKSTTERVTISIKSLSNVLRDIDDIDPENVLSNGQKRHLEQISRSCYTVLQDLDHVLGKFQDLDLDSSSTDNTGTDIDTRASRGLGYLSRRVWQRLNWDPKEIQNFERRICGQVVTFNLFLARLNLYAVHPDVNLAVCETTARSREEIAAIKHYQIDEEYDKILDWLSPVNYAAQQNDFLNQHQEGSGQWLLGASQFRQWAEKDKETLFCPGIPGAGKTIMVSMIIDFLEQKFGRRGNIGIAYLYCSFRQRPTQTFRDLLASLVRQIVQRDHAIPDCVRDAYSQARNKKIQPSVSELLQFLQLFSNQLSRVFIVVDALDECESTVRESLLAAIYSLQDRCNVNFLATSRYIPDTIAAFEGCPSLEIRATMEDVWRYLRSQLSRLPSFVSRNKELQCEIIAEVSKAVGGMFLLAKLHLDSLVGKRSQKALRTALKSLPTGSNAYDSAYRTAMERIEGQVSDQKEMAKQVLSWITCAGPLTTRELQHALAVEIGHPRLDETNISDVEDIVSVCAGLVIVDEQSNIIRLVHYTAQEYFERTWTEWFPDAQKNIAATCITYLSFDFGEDQHRPLGDLQPKHQASLFDKYPLYRYAAQNWGRHGPTDALSPVMVLGFLENRLNVLRSARVLLEDKAWPVPTDLHGIHLASYFGLEDAVCRLIAGGHDVDMVDSLGRSPLSWAAAEGHKSLVELLLRYEAAAPDLKDASGQTPLSWAAKTGHSDVVEVLVNYAADKNFRDKNGQTPLALAAVYGQRAVIWCLIKAGADVSCKDDNGLTALALALKHEHLDIVPDLLQAKQPGSEDNSAIPCSSVQSIGCGNQNIPEDKTRHELGCENNPSLPSGYQNQTCHIPQGSTASDNKLITVPNAPPGDGTCTTAERHLGSDGNWSGSGTRSQLAERQLNQHNTV